MIEEMAKVVEYDGKYAWLETTVKTTCGSCKANDSCATSTIAKAFTPKKEHIKIEVPCELVVGQFVKIGINEASLVKASMLVYLMPLLVLLASVLTLQFLIPNAHELLVLMLSLIASAFSYKYIAYLVNHSKQKFKPMFLGASKSLVKVAKQEIPTAKLN